MKMEKATLIQFVPIGIDILGNPTTERTEYKDIKIRITQWTEGDMVVQGRAITTNMRKLLTQAPLADLEACSQIVVEDEGYTMHKITDLGRWKLVYIAPIKGPVPVVNEY